jgi:urease accessory protein
LTVGYSDWPGWVAWEIGIKKGWFAEEGVNVQFEWMDYLASMEAYGAGKLALLDQLSCALRPTRQLREAASKIGRQQWKLYQRTWNDSFEIELPHYQSPIVLAVISANESIPVNAALSSLAYQTYSALLQAALKLLPIGPTTTQQLLHEALLEITPHLETAAHVPEKEIGSFNTVWDISASQHETANARMFIS